MSNIVPFGFQLLISATLLFVVPYVSSSQTTFWKDVNSPTSEGIFRLLATGNATLFVASDSSGIYRSTNDGLSWAPANSGLTDLRIRALARAQDGSILAGGRAWNIFRSTNNGQGWLNVYYSGIHINDMAVSPTGEAYAVGARWAFRSTNHGANWSGLGDNIALRLNCVAVTPQGIPYMSGYERGVSWTPNGGQTWSYILVFYCQLPGLCGDVLAAVTSPSGNMFLGNDGQGIARSTGDLWTWSWLLSGLADTRISALAADSNGFIYAGTLGGGGVFRSTNNGDTWEPLNSGLTDPIIKCLAIGQNGYLYAGTAGGRIFRSMDRVTSSSENPVLGPVSFALFQNYPNPLNPTTTITYRLPMESNVTLTVFNCLGQTVRTLVNQQEQVGVKSVLWDSMNESGTPVPSGVYFYRVEARAASGSTSGFSQTLKMLLVR